MHKPATIVALICIVASYNVSSVVFYVQYAKPLGRILISDLVLTNLFMHSLPGRILLCAFVYTKGVFVWDIITFVKFMQICRSRIIDS